MCQNKGITLRTNTMEKKFTIKESLSYAWESYKKNLSLFIPIMLVMAALQIIGAVFGYNIDPVTGQESGYVSVSMLLWLVGIITSIGLIAIGVGVYDGKKMPASALFTSCTSLKQFFFYIIVYILYSLIMIGGLLLLIVPGFVWMLKYYFCTYFVVDKNYGPIEALQASGKITYGHKWQLLGFTCVVILLNLLGLLAFVVGLFVTVPMTILAYAYIFRTLSGAEAEKESAASEKSEEGEKEEVLSPVMTSKS